MNKSKKKPMTGRDFEALPDIEKERIFHELDNLTEDQIKAARPLTARQKRAHFRPPIRNGGGTKPGAVSTETISVSLEKTLLREANAYAKTKGMKRSELVSAGLRLAMSRGA